MQQAAATLSRSDWRLIMLASLGGALEFYDFVVYSQFAQYIGRNFFPNTDAMVSLIVSFSVFAVGYFARPLGGIFFSHIGDRIGRRRVLIITILAMSAATAGIGLLPTYAQWGITASVLLVLLRIIQGFCLGGELPGAIAYVVETAPRRSGFSVGIVFFCVNTGVAARRAAESGRARDADGRADRRLGLAHRLPRRRRARARQLRSPFVARGEPRIRAHSRHR